MNLPAPFYQDDSCTIYNADCREILPLLPRFGLLLTDPPYGIDAGNMTMGYANTHRDKIERNDWDAERPSIELIDACCRKSDEAVIWGGNYFELKPSRAFLVWDKTPEMQGRSFAEAEVAWCSWDAVARVFRYAPTQMKKLHKTQKPVPLMRWCLTHAPDAQTILDPFMGSGTTLVAAKLEGRKAVGIEISEKYCELAANRLRQKVLNFEEATR
jgi:DNA modification methylase